MRVTSSTALSKTSSLAFDGAVNPLSLRTNCSDAARTSSSVAGGSKLNSVLMLLHMAHRSGVVREAGMTRASLLHSKVVKRARAPVRPKDRQRVLLARQRLKMASSAHGYVRGSTARFYDWLMATSSTSTRPEGPPVWICGDCHVGNLGPVAHSDGRVEVQIRDLDQSVIGNPAHDLIRLG